MKVVSLHIIVFLLLISAHVAGKNIRYEPPKWISENYRKEMFPSSRYFVQFESYKNVRRKDREQKEKELITLLQEKISKQIQSFISTESVLFQSESDEYGYNELFVKETRIVSDVILFDSEPTVWYDKRDRRLFAMYAVEKKDLGEKYITLLTGKLTSLSKELENYNATLTLCHLHTRDIRRYTLKADTVIIAAGAPRFFTADYFRSDRTQYVIDIGINKDENDKLCGDVDFDHVAPLVRGITPVPGGIGPMTIFSLIQNLLLAAQKGV